MGEKAEEVKGRSDKEEERDRKRGGQSTPEKQRREEKRRKGRNTGFIKETCFPFFKGKK